ncbi:Sensory transduction protein regX3 [Candidatus Izimaplasma bacterium HR1]|jgi:two-component system response regulator VanR|uniref:response regulator transcription factor n=1 Tax=Candidatus Izimoplasma sp. HR1 TaxID=1541959 RepID=UPI0004F8A4D6|nr:Sensory transduction protein regX3 [Candidatus Izimaplasma bacterium HR1]
MKKVLIIEDELSLQNIIAAYFRKNEYEVIVALDGLEGLEAFRSNKIDIVCSDIMMPNIDGWQVVKSIRQTSNIPIILMTALDSEIDQLKGFDLMVDDYVTKPFSPSVLVAKANSILRRSDSSNQKQSSVIIQIKSLSINLDSRDVKVGDETIKLSKTEFDLLSFFVKNQNIALDRVTILDEVWGLDVYVEERVVDTYIKVLRKKLSVAGKYIKTVFGIGYKFTVEED